MKPKSSPVSSPQGNLFHVELAEMIDMRHPLVKLAQTINWETFESVLDCHFSKTDGAPAKPVRLMAGLHYLKHTYNLSDEATVARWVENPYWQHFCGRKYFEYEPPIHPSLMTRWRKMVGDGALEKMLEETISSALRMKAVKPSSLSKVNVDTTVQEKAVTYPTDVKLYHAMREKLVKLADVHGVELRQSYRRVSKKAVAQSGRYFHARQGKRARREVKRVKTYLGRVYRDISRKISGNAVLEEAFSEALGMAGRLLRQKKDDKNKLYSIHAPEVECISKGKAHKKYEFGNKASLATTSREGLAVGAMGLHGNPYDGHTLSAQLEQVERLCGENANRLERVFVDRGYQGHGYEGELEVHICGPKSKRLPRYLRRLCNRRSAIEPAIGHMKNDGRLGRNFLLGKEGDRANVILCACGHNLRLLLRCFLSFFDCWTPFLAWLAGFVRRVRGSTMALAG
jgi:IS5 family transposase